MPRAKTLSSLFSSTTKLFQTATEGKPYVPDILTFCYSAGYLNLESKGIKLYPIQELVLRAFYRGSIGNDKPEHMVMTEDEQKLCVDKGLLDDHNGDILKKWNTGLPFREMVLVWGRRSGKDFVCSIIALYEAMRLLECPGGDPYKLYKIDNSAPFNILTIANNKEQAGILFREIQGKLLQSPYFEDKIGAITAGRIHLQTPQNKKDNESAKAKGLAEHPGSVVIETGHSNSNGLVGKGCFVLMLDEAGLYKRTGGPGSDEQLYGNLSPTTRTYVRHEYKKDKDGNIISREDIYDGKIISISSPRGMDGVFYRKYKTSPESPQMLMCRLPTWDVNIWHTEEGLRREEQSMTDVKFKMEYGAEFSGTEGENFFPPDYVNKCFHTHQFASVQKDGDHWGKPGITYFAHLDPAISSHNYALAVVHKHHFVNQQTKKIDYWMVLDHLKVWTPKDGQPIKIDEVDEYVIDLRRRYHLALVTYDQWNTAHYLTRVCSKKGLQKAIDINVGDEVRNRFGVYETVLAKKVDDQANCLEITTKFGYQVTVTENHPFWNGSEFVLAKNCKVKDKLCLQDFQHFGVIDDSEKAGVIGYLISEGYCCKERRVIEFCNTDTEVLDDYEGLLMSIGINSKRYLYVKQKEHHLDAWKIVSTKENYDKLFAWGAVGDSYTKVVPNFVLEGNKKTVSTFLSCLYEGDGNTCKNPNALLIEYNTSSAELAKDIQLLILNFGIKSSLKKYDNKWLNGKQYTFYRISIYGTNIDIFAKEIGFRSSRKNAELAEILKLKNEVDLRSEYNRKNTGQRVIVGKKSSRSRQMWDRIVSIEPATTTICHLEVSGDHTYISNGIVSHNSQSSIEKMRKNGIPAICTRFNKHYKIQIYDELYKLVADEKLKLPYIKLLSDEMLNLQRKFMAQGYRIYPKTDGECKTDDTCDALAGACFNALRTDNARLPQGKLVNMGVTPSSNSITWRSMQGVPLGTGTGQQVSSWLQNRTPPWSR